jgi:hypothetical protein
LISCRQATSGRWRRSHGMKPFEAADRRPFTFRVMIRMKVGKIAANRNRSTAA